PVNGAARSAFDAFAVIVVFPLLVATAANATARGGFAWLCGTAGLLSYGVYVLQVPLLGWIDLVLAHFLGLNFQLPGAAHVALVVGGSIAAAAILNVVYDVPVRRLLSGRRRGAAGRVEAAPTKL